MSTAREPCPNCQLPFYTDRNSECPYCGATASAGEGSSTTDESAETAQPAAAASSEVDTSPAGSVARPTPPERPRTTCSNCGLPHYADDGNGCPYCEMAGTAAEPESAPATATGPTGSSEASTSADGPSADDGESSGSGGILASLKRLVGR